jgi:hypothetical protein
MVIVGMMCYPPSSAAEIGKNFLGQKPLPDYISMKGPYLLGVKGEGIQAISIYEAEKEKLSDALELITNRYISYRDIPGFTCSVNAWLEASEALKMIGMA